VWRQNEFQSGGTGPARKWGGGTDPARSAGKFYFDRASPLFGSTSTINRFGERFRDDQYTVWSVTCLVSFYSRCPPPCPMESAPLLRNFYIFCPLSPHLPQSSFVPSRPLPSVRSKSLKCSGGAFSERVLGQSRNRCILALKFDTWLQKI